VNIYDKLLDWFEDENHWCKGRLFMTYGGGEGVDRVDSVDCECTCIVGACFKFCSSYVAANQLIYRLSSCSDLLCNLSVFNDHNDTTIEDIRALIRRARDCYIQEKL
jgi:hypothetical protein